MDLKQKAKELVAQMTLAEKATLCGGSSFWYTSGVERLGLPAQMLTDGPHGLRKQDGASDHLGLNNSVPATSFPTACTTACSFDRALLQRMGESLGEKCTRENVAVILGPGVNMKRSPLCGRNFEYFSEDPCLAGELAAALVQGIQSRGTGTSLKHFAANSQETCRMVNDSVVDERALEEIYLPAFETVVKKAQPWTVMCSYNKINGTYSDKNKWLLTDTLRKKWGFRGLVVSDWGAVSNRVEAVKAGMDLEMPMLGKDSAEMLCAAVNSGKLEQSALDACACRVTELLLKAQQEKAPSARTEADDNALAREIAAQSAVLLKNEDILPLAAETKVAFIGRMAKTMRYQGAGSSKINPSYLDSPMEAAEAAGLHPLYADGYGEKSGSVDEALLRQAAETARQVQVAVVFAGLPDEYESEGFDRTGMEMPISHVRLIETVAAANPNTVVVMQCGSPVEMPWRGSVKGILLMYLAGQAGGAATVDLLWGKENPSGHLGETWPEKAADAPSAANFPGQPKAVEYRESIYIGYRYYDKAGCPVAYPFGYGLSYTDFAYREIRAVPENEDAVRVSVTVENTGSRCGRAVIQLYVGREGESHIFRAEKELRDFAKVLLAPGESKTVEFVLGARAFSYYNTAAAGWAIEQGTYQIMAGPDSRNLPLCAQIKMAGDGKEAFLPAQGAVQAEYSRPSVPFRPSDAAFTALLGHTPPAGTHRKGEPFTIDSTMDDIKNTIIGRAIRKKMGASLAEMGKDDPSMRRMAEAMMYTSPLRMMRMTGGLTWTNLEGMADMANGHFIRGIRKMKTK